MNAMTPTETTGRQRADLWLFRARLFKSRSLAARFIEAGGVRLERTGQVQRLGRASFNVQPGDMLIFVRGADPVRIRVLDLGERRGPPSEAQGLYERLDRTGAERPQER